MNRRVASGLIRRALPLALLAGMVLVVAACGDEDVDVAQTPQTSETSQAPAAPVEEPRAAVIDVVASTEIVAEWVAQVGGQRVRVVALVPAGADAHTFELTPDNVRAVAGADLVVINGGGLEGAYEGTIEENLGDTPLVELSDWIELEEFPPGFAHDEHEEEGEHHDEGEGEEEGEHHDEGEGEEEGEHHDEGEGEEEGEHHDEGEGEEEGEHHDEGEGEEEGEHHDEGEGEEEGEHHDEGHGSLDPHFWLDPTRAIQAVQAIRDELSALLPDGAEEFAANASRYIAEIEAADAEVQALLVDLAPEHRVLVTFHDAFGYFARRYDLEVFGFVIEGPEQEASAAELADLIEAMRDRGVTRVYREPQFESSTIDQIADETGAEVRVIYSQPVGEVESYTDLMRANGRALAE
ncbi:MAG: metal ABC transporter substrate-binding protein [Chloroflexi bacterium]|nr:metal ABC transporter substrate-binding protein [Chloroflexota bacterium]